AEYQEIIYDGLFSLIDDLREPPKDSETIQVAINNTFMFMQDNASCHKAKEVLEFLEENQIPIMKWPPQSLELNSIENLWVVFEAAFNKRFIQLFNHPSKSLEARYRYGEVLQQVWYEISQDLINKLVDSMPRRVQAVIDANGSWIDY